MAFKDYTCKEFTDELSSNAPVPGGGGAAAVCAAVGTALGCMAGSLTIGKKSFADKEDALRRAAESAKKLQAELLSLADEDATCFLPLLDAYKIPKGTQEEAEEREAEIEKCLNNAASAPVKIMEKCCEAIELTEFFALNCSAASLSDAGCGALTLKAALQAAAINVTVNTAAMKNRQEAENINAHVKELLYIYKSKADRVAELVKQKLGVII